MPAEAPHLNPADDAFDLFSSGPVKRSVTIAGHQTSISLEPLFWAALREAAAQDGLPLNAVIARIDADRIATPQPANLASAIRLWLFARARMTSCDKHESHSQ
jgi:predicted DNA-binding ribbon-helix-helix protein